MLHISTIPSRMVKAKAVQLVYLCERMRADERHQWCVLSCEEEFDAEKAAAYFIGLSGFKFAMIGDDGYPVAAGGYRPTDYPGVWQSWMITTDAAWKLLPKSLTKGARWMADFMFDKVQARRLETNALAFRTQAIDWYLRGLKLTCEGTRRSFGVNGEDLVEFARVRGD